MLSRLLPLLLALGLAPPPAQQPPHVTPAVFSVIVTGTVVEASTGVPLAGAQVVVLDTSTGALSNDAGHFRLVLPAVWAGREVHVEARLLGYGSERRTVTLGEGTNVVEFRLSSRAVAMEEVEVTADAAISLRAMPATVQGVAAPVSWAPGAARKRMDAGWGPTPRYNTESYALIEENDFRAVSVDPVSTFSIDVDRASYANVRRFLRSGIRPPVDAVRIEELINYFSYDDPTPRDGTPFAVTTEVAPAPWQPRHHLVRIALRAPDVELEDLPPSNLVFLLDVSGSMGSPDKLPLVKQSLAMLVDQLRAQDRVAIVVYAGAAGLVLPSTPGSRKDEILAGLERLEAGGSTAGGAGLELAYRVALENHVDGGNNRVILATDGDFNVGPSSDAAMIRLIEEKREQGTFLTVLGFGTGNLKDSKMEQLADHGNGSYAYIDSALEARKALVTEMGGTLLTVAKDVKIQVEFNPARVEGYRLIGYENRLLAEEDFDDDTKDAGEIGAGHSVVALYEVVPAGAGTVALRTPATRRYEANRGTPASGAAEDFDDELLFVKVRYKEPTGTTSRLLDFSVRGDERAAGEDFRFAAAVAAWGMLLRDSEHCRGFTLDEVVRMARGSMGVDRGGYRAEFLSLVEASRPLLEATELR